MNINTRGLTNFTRAGVHGEGEVLEFDGEYIVNVKTAEVVRGRDRTALFLWLQVQDEDAKPAKASIFTSMFIDGMNRKGDPYVANLGKFLYSLGRTDKELADLEKFGQVPAESLTQAITRAGHNVGFTTLTREAVVGVGPRMRVEWIPEHYYHLMKAEELHRRRSPLTSGPRDIVAAAI